MAKFELLKINNWGTIFFLVHSLLYAQTSSFKTLFLSFFSHLKSFKFCSWASDISARAHRVHWEGLYLHSLAPHMQT